MTNSKLIGAGVLVVVGLAVITAGSIALPSLSNGDTYKYKAVDVSLVMDENKKIETILNDNAKDGWEYVNVLGLSAVFKKK